MINKRCSNYSSIIIFLILFSATLKLLAQNNITTTSPNSKIHLEFYLQTEKPYYSVTFENKVIIAPSILGFKFLNNEPIQDDLKILNFTKRYFSETWQPVWGTQEFISNEYNELIVYLEEKSKQQRKINLIFRVFNDGIGFRYEFPEQTNINNVVITDELTEFNLTEDHTCWWIPADYDSYEYLYNKTKLSEIDLLKHNYEIRGDRNHPNPRAVNTPITMETKDGLFLSFHEANLTDYAGLTIEVKDNYELEVDLVPWADGTKVKTSVPFKTPWRTIQISESAAGLLESNLILNLNEPNVVEDVSWIEPMKYVGIWWEMHINKSSWSLGHKDGTWGSEKGKTHGATNANAKKYIDFASEHGIKGVLIEGWNTGWENWGQTETGYFDFTTLYSDFNLQEVVSYAKDKGVEIIGHHETGGQAAHYETRLDSAFKLYNGLGIRAVKTGYAGQIIPKGEFHHGQFMVRHYRKVLEAAAKYKIMLDAHEPIAATGLRRTYPNMMTREGVRGMEYNAWSDGNTPEHTTIIPFTRMLGGPIDYTPGIFDLTFDKYKPNNRVYTTLAKQLAYYVIIYSPMQMAADLPTNYEGNKAFDFIEQVPVNWNDTKILNAKIGDFVTIVRRKNDTWYLGSITDEHARILHVSLSFLDQDKKYEATIFRDGNNTDWETNPTEIEIKNKTVDSRTQLRIKLAKSGGQAIIFKPIGKN